MTLITGIAAAVFVLVARHLITYVVNDGARIAALNQL